MSAHIYLLLTINDFGSIRKMQNFQIRMLRNANRVRLALRAQSEAVKERVDDVIVVTSKSVVVKVQYC